MRISMVSEHASPLAALGGVDAGGQNVHVAALSSALAARGHEVTVYTRRDDEALPDRVTAVPGVEVVHVTAGPATQVPKDELLPYMPALASGILRDWLRTQPDVVHAHFWMSGLAALRAAGAANARATATRVPVAQTFHALGSVKRRHQGADDTSPAERAELEPWVGRTVDGVLATCSDEVRELIELGIDPARISVAPCGVDTRLLTPEGPRDPRVRPHRIGVVGRLVPRKGVGTVVEALGLLHRDDVELVVVGGTGEDDGEITRLRDLAERGGVADRVQFRGAVPHDRLGVMLRSFDAVVCVPWYEPFGIVPLEAMACGVPVVGSAVGGLLDTVVDGVTGLHVPPRDAVATAAAIGRLLDTPGLGRRLGGNARTRVERDYTWDHVAELTEGFYTDLLEARAASDPAVPEPPTALAL